MKYSTYKEIICEETAETFQLGDIVTIRHPNGGGAGGCRITKITDTGLHYSQGGRRDKSVQYKDIVELRRQLN